MSIRPIDLQNLFMRLNQVGKKQAEVHEAATIHQSVQGKEIVNESEQLDHSVNETKETNTESDKVDEREESPETEERELPKRKAKKEEEEPEKKKPHVARDPDLGQNIDIGV